MKRLSRMVIPCTMFVGACGGGGGGGDDGLGFTPTNVATISYFGALDTVTIDGCGAQIRGGAGTIGCDDPGSNGPNGGYLFEQITQSDGSKIAVFVAGNFVVPPGVAATLFNTSTPVALVALGAIDIDGSITVEPGTGGGGTTADSAASSRGSGVGGGLPATQGTSDGGGSYCGKGGGGAGGIPGMGGPTYGNATLSPLMPGSSGGGQFVGAGGGAIQLVAGGTVRIGAAGFVTVPGGGGDWGAGGSGGAILIEATNIQISGRIAANGGGGGAGTGPEDGRAGGSDDVPAAGGAGGPEGGGGGAGGAGNAVDGGPGQINATYLNGSFAGNGGGGAGRIRLNSKTGAATVAGIVSPSLTSGCATQGTLTP